MGERQGDYYIHLQKHSSDAEEETRGQYFYGIAQIETDCVAYE